MSAEEKLAAIRDYVLSMRAQCGIVPGCVPPPELSCEAFGEFRNLVERQLVNTVEGFGAWSELGYPPVLDDAYWYVTARIKGY